MRKILGRLFLLLAVVGVGVGVWAYQNVFTDWVESLTDVPAPDPQQPVPTPEVYTVLSDDLEVHRKRLGQAYQKAKTDAERNQVLLETRFLLEQSLVRLMRCWLGTPWDFNGTAHEPGGGKVACGYFVSSVMQDAGFKVEWAPLAQQPSQNILGTFVPREDMTLKVGVEYDDFLDAAMAAGPGIYIVGLDRHVGFMVVTEENEMRFIHSSGSTPRKVVDEGRAEAHVLQRSYYRVTGNLTANQTLLQNWLMGRPFKTRKL